MRIKIPEAFIFMKVGNHAGENFEQILERKNNEFKRTGRIFWGYGGKSCHPLTQVQPFAKIQVKKYGNICLMMEMIDSHADPEIVPAKEYSDDGVTWKEIPDGIEVIGSRYALILNEIKPGDLDIAIDNYVVGIGPSRGKIASEYIQGRIDKACLSFKVGKKNKKVVEKRHFSYSSKLIEPYAVMLR